MEGGREEGRGGREGGRNGGKEGKEGRTFFYLTMRATHFIYGYMVSDI